MPITRRSVTDCDLPVYIPTHMPVCIPMYTDTHAHADASTYAYTHAYAHSLCACLSTCLYTCLHTCLYACQCTCLHTCLRTARQIRNSPVPTPRGTAPSGPAIELAAPPIELEQRTAAVRNYCIGHNHTGHGYGLYSHGELYLYSYGELYTLGE